MSGAHGCCGGHDGRRGRGGRGGRGRGGRGPSRCFRCGEVGHFSSECTSEAALEQREYRVPPIPHHTVPYVDTHCHLDYICEQARQPTWSAFLASNPMPVTFEGCITTFCDSTAICSSFSQYEDLTAHHPDVYHTWGLHPHNAKYWNERIESRIVEMLGHPKCVGFGEIGLDVTSDKKGGSDEGQQLQVFARQLELAQVFADKPVVIHYRGPTEVLLELLRPLPSTQKLHLHCWGDPSIEAAERLMSRYSRLYFGFTGLVVDNPRYTSLLAQLPLERVVLESDAPYMLPTCLKPPKGSRIMMPVNHPGNIPFVAEAIAVARRGRTDIDSVLRRVADNVFALYGIGKSGHTTKPSAASPSPKRSGVAAPTVDTEEWPALPFS